MRRVLLLTVLAIAIAAAWCAYRDRSSWNPPAQFAPPLRPAFGARVVDGQLEVWLGTPCHGVTELVVVFDPATDRRQRRILWAEPPGRTLERLRPAGPNPGWTVTAELPPGFDWRRARELSVLIEGADAHWSSVARVDALLAGSETHPASRYLFEGIGWLDVAGVAAGNGRDFLTLCTAAPAVR